MSAQKAEGKRVLFVISPRKFRDEELLQPKQIFYAAGAETRVASTVHEKCTGMMGAKVTPDLLIRDASVADYDALVLVGGAGAPEHLWDDQDLQSLVREFNGRGKVVASICLSGVVLARAGVLSGKEATVFKTIDSLKEYEAAGVLYKQRNIVTSGNIVTADGPAAAREFGRTIVQMLMS